MECGTLYDHEQKITRTEMVEILVNAKQCIFTVSYRK